MINQLIKCLYAPVINLPKEEDFYHQVSKEIEASSISSQIYFLLKERHQLENVPLFFQNRLKQKYQEALYQNFFIRSQTNQIFNRFEKMELEVIPLKGVYFAEKYFGHIGARATSDIDLLIKKQNLNRAVEAVKSLGFEIESQPIPSHFHSSFSKKIPGSSIPLTVEIHWDVVKETTSNFKIKEFWDQSSCIGEFRVY